MNTTELRAIYNRKNFVILDTETTGLKRPAEICQIAIIDPEGKEVLYSLVKTANPIPAEATQIHGITDDMVLDAPTWPVIKEAVLKAIRGKDVLVYNATYDRHMMHCSDEMWSLPQTDYKIDARWECVMLWYADVWGEWDDYHQNNRWQRLGNAYMQCGGEDLTGAHNALGDCLMTKYIIDHHMNIPFDPPFDTQIANV